MKAFIRWGGTIVQDVASRVLPVIFVIDLWFIVLTFFSDYFDMLFLPILIGVPLVICAIIYPMPKDR
ncbi:hypothetical protein MC77_014840 [Citrobacter koseri]|uniref:hypothetical protein n=1 Tax=Citrobacter koseri TaxID=545 RepID=UPI00053912AD|nr:hypothetical protein [Citrobacter koseri]PNO80126.1 hypothetical protein MC77_014840 [Citrobacter koseri]